MVLCRSIFARDGLYDSSFTVASIVTVASGDAVVSLVAVATIVIVAASVGVEVYLISEVAGSTTVLQHINTKINLPKNMICLKFRTNSTLPNNLLQFSRSQMITLNKQFASIQVL